MTLKTIFTRTATIALAAAALNAPTAALAQPIDTSAPLPGIQDMRSPDAATGSDIGAAQKQDMRSPDASDAATRSDSATPPLPGPPTWPLHPKPINTPTAATDHGEGATTIGLGIAGSLLAVACIAGIAHLSRRTRRRRVAA